MFSNANTAIEGLSGGGGANGFSAAAGFASASRPTCSE